MIIFLEYENGRYKYTSNKIQRPNGNNNDKDSFEYVVIHLQMIQNIIDRMGRNSFLIKGWCLTLSM